MTDLQPSRPTTKFRFQISILHVFLSLMPVAFGCQTSDSEVKANADATMLESQRAVVRGALDAGKSEAALATLRHLLQQYPGDASMHNLMGLTQLTLRNNERAIKEFQIAYKLDKQVATGLNLSSALISSGDYKRSIKLLTQLVAQAESANYPYKERLFHNLGYAYSRDHNTTKAELWLKRSLEENPTFFLSHLELARIYENSNRLALATQHYLKATDYCLVCFEPVQSLSSLYVRTGRTEDARRLLIKYGKLDGLSAVDKNKAKTLYSQLAVPVGETSKRGG